MFTLFNIGLVVGFCLLLIAGATLLRKRKVADDAANSVPAAWTPENSATYADSPIEPMPAVVPLPKITTEVWPAIEPIAFDHLTDLKKVDAAFPDVVLVTKPRKKRNTKTAHVAPYRTPGSRA